VEKVTSFSPFLHFLPAPRKRILPLFGFFFFTQTLALAFAAFAELVRRIPASAMLATNASASQRRCDVAGIEGLKLISAESPWLEVGAQVSDGNAGKITDVSVKRPPNPPDIRPIFERKY
jgi:hypothetical protein